MRTDIIPFAPLLFSFINKYQFNKNNLNESNNNGVTPLTVAIEECQEQIIEGLLSLRANPFVENIHGNTPITLARKNNLLHLLKPAIDLCSCIILTCRVSAVFYYGNKTYVIKKVLQGGSCSIAVFEIEDTNTFERYFAKIKSCFGGLEIRNYITLEQYEDLFVIKNLLLYDKKNRSQPIIKNVYCLIQKIVAGKPVSMAVRFSKSREEKQQIVINTINSLCELHKKGYIHNDALPDNCLWNEYTKEAIFIDYDVMRMASDLITQEAWKEAEYYDLKRLIMGDIIVEEGEKIVVPGLMHCLDNIKKILEDFNNPILDIKVKNRLLANF